jgi:YegS/Rv2252/BmrU family lipid kinase
LPEPTPGYLLIGNAGAGGADDRDAALEVLGETGDVELADTASPEELDTVLDRRGGRTVVVAGGDGSLHAVVSALHRRGELDDAVVGLIPLGTGNDFARGAGIPLDPAEAARLLVRGRPRAVDLVVDDAGGVVVNNVHIGAGAEASRAAAPWKRRLGPLGYVVGAALAGLRPPTLRLRVTADDEVVSDRPTLQVAIGNAPYVGGGTELTPEAEPDSGAVDVMVSHALSLPARLGYVLRLRRGEHHRRADVTYRRASTVTVSGEPFHASADGEIQGPLRTRTWSVVPSGLTMVTGASPTDRT